MILSHGSSGEQSSSGAGEDLLAAVDVVGRAAERRIGHDVHGERGDVGRTDDPPDRQRGAQLIAALVKFTAPEADKPRLREEWSYLIRRTISTLRAA